MKDIDPETALGVDNPAWKLLGEDEETEESKKAAEPYKDQIEAGANAELAQIVAEDAKEGKVGKYCIYIARPLFLVCAKKFRVKKSENCVSKNFVLKNPKISC